MSGIVAIISQRPPEECSRLVQAMTATMKRESFHTSGTHSIPDMGIYAGWVAQENSPAGNRLLWNEKQDVALLLSGECFPAPETGPELRREGHDVDAHKASWLVHLYEEQGEQFFGNLNGLFSGLLIDKRNRKAFLFNDRYGAERIYWHETADTFYLASEAKALLRVLPESRRFDEQGLAQFLTYGTSLGEQTLFKGISSLPGGSLWSFDNRTLARHKYFSPETWESQTPLSVESFDSAFQEAFTRILPRYLESDIKLGVSLTAGLDTRMIMARLPETPLNAISYTYSAKDTNILDARIAAKVAAACGLQHKILEIGPDFFTDFSSWADKTVYATDGYFGIMGTHEIYLSRQARELSPVRLTGIFGGEIFRSVSMFRPLKLSSELLQQPATAGPLHLENEHHVTFAAFKEIPWNRFGTVSACRSQLCLRTPYMDNELVKLAYRTPVDFRKSSDSAVRFIRHNSKAVANISTDMGYLGPAFGPAAAFNRKVAKVLFKFDYHYNHGLPQKLSALEPVFRPVAACLQHFGTHRFLQYFNWFRKELAPYVRESLTSAHTLQMPIWNTNFLKRMTDEHISGQKNYSEEINTVLTLSAVDRLLFRDFSGESNQPIPANNGSEKTPHGGTAVLS